MYSESDIARTQVLARTNLPQFAKENLYIKDLYTRVIKNLDFNYTQRRLWDDHFQYFEIEPIRLAILKYRQGGGFSTFGSAFAIAQMYGAPGFDATFYAQTDPYRKNFEERFKIFDERMPLSVRYDNSFFGAKYCQYPDMNSLISMQTAGGLDTRAKAVGRGVARSLLWFSEVSFYADSDEIINSSVPAVQYQPRTAIVYETTAGTQGDTFYHIYQDAKYGRSGYKALFYAWHYNPEYRAALYPGEIVDLSDEEIHAQKKYHLTLEQMKWRRRQIKQMVGKTKDSPLRAFKRDYPEDDRTCFQGIVFPFFSADSIDRHHDYILENQIKPLTNTQQYIRIFYMPKSGRKYSMGADPSEGLPKGDFSAAVVLDAENGEMVAMIHGRMDVALFAKLLNNIGRMYNDAHLVVERNNHGIYTIRKLQEEYRYPNLYQMPKSSRGSRKDIDTFGHIMGSNKAELLDDLSEALDEDRVLPNDEETIEELSLFEQRGKQLGAQGNNHDDLVIALALAHKGCRYVSVPIEIYTHRVNTDYTRVIKLPRKRFSYLRNLAA